MLGNYRIAIDGGEGDIFRIGVGQLERIINVLIVVHQPIYLYKL